jgi:hypothetical protein
MHAVPVATVLVQGTIADPEPPLAGLAPPLAGPEPPLAGPAPPLAGPEPPLAGTAPPLAGPEPPFAGPAPPFAEGPVTSVTPPHARATKTTGRTKVFRFIARLADILLRGLAQSTNLTSGRVAVGAGRRCGGLVEPRGRNESNPGRQRPYIPWECREVSFGSRASWGSSWSLAARRVARRTGAPTRDQAGRRQRPAPAGDPPALNLQAKTAE